MHIHIDNQQHDTIKTYRSEKTVSSLSAYASKLKRLASEAVGTVQRRFTHVEFVEYRPPVTVADRFWNIKRKLDDARNKVCDVRIISVVNDRSGSSDTVAHTISFSRKLKRQDHRDLRLDYFPLFTYNVIELYEPTGKVMVVISDTRDITSFIEGLLAEVGWSRGLYSQATYMSSQDSGISED